MALFKRNLRQTLSLANVKRCAIHNLNDVTFKSSYDFGLAVTSEMLDSVGKVVAKK
jgi:hypothetical protein